MEKINSATRLYCILGNPCSHSKSPLIHNTGFRDNNINAVYLAFEPKDISIAADSIRNFNIKGASVTIPFKESIIKYLDWIDDEALQIGAVNTIVNNNGKLFGYNTDSKAAVDPLKPLGIKDKTVGIIGAGGAAKAVAYGIWKNHGNMVIANRSEDKGRALAEQYNSPFVLLEDLGKIDLDIVINTSSMGMDPNREILPFPAQSLVPEMVVMDVVYNPLDTRLVLLARKKGCIVIDGLAMFVAQGAAQFELWTGIRPDTEKMRQSVLESLAQEN